MEQHPVLRLAHFDEAGLNSNAVHWLPCTVEHTGPAPVSNYFYPAATELQVDGAPVLEAAFRGRLLRGVAHPLPDGLTGVVLAKEPRGGAWRATSGFSSFTAWNHDTTPGSADPAARLLQWLRLSKTLGAPVTAEEVDALCAARREADAQKRRMAVEQ